MEMTKEQLELIANQLATIKERSPFYAKKFEGIDVADVRTQADFEKLPFSEKDDLRAVYPLGLQAVPDEEVVRIHSSSGTTGTPVIIPYTQQDVIDWATQFARCYEMAGITPLDRIQITPGYGLWTAGIGFQLGAERLGAMAIPMGPGNTEKQLKMMKVILYLYHKCQEIVARQVPISKIMQTGLFDKLVKIKYDIPNDKLELFDSYEAEIDQSLKGFLK